MRPRKETQVSVGKRPHGAQPWMPSCGLLHFCGLQETEGFYPVLRLCLRMLEGKSLSLKDPSPDFPSLGNNGLKKEKTKDC